MGFGNSLSRLLKTYNRDAPTEHLMTQLWSHENLAPSQICFFHCTTNRLSSWENFGENLANFIQIMGVQKYSWIVYRSDPSGCCTWGSDPSDCCICRFDPSGCCICTQLNLCSFPLSEGSGKLPFTFWNSLHFNCQVQSFLIPPGLSNHFPFCPFASLLYSYLTALYICVSICCLFVYPQFENPSCVRYTRLTYWCFGRASVCYVPDNINWIPRTHEVKVGNQFYSLVPWPPYIPWHTWNYICNNNSYYCYFKHY